MNAFQSAKWLQWLAAPLLALSVNSAVAQSASNAVVRLIAPYPPGGGPEQVLRAVANGVQQRLGQTVVIDYKPGAGGNLGAAETARAGANGVTLMLGQETVQTLNPLIYKNLGYDKADLVPLALMGSFSQVLACNASLKIKSLAELVAKAKTSQITYASGGQGSPGHLTMEMLLAASGTKMTHVPYKGPAQAVQDLIGGQVDCGFLVGAILAEHIKSGRLTAIASSGLKRSVTLPNLPTVAESGYPDFNATFWLVMFAPRAMDAATQSKLQTVLIDTVRSTEVREAMHANDTLPEGTGAEQARREIDAMARHWAAVVNRIGLKVE